MRKWSDAELQIINKYGAKKLLHELYVMIPNRTPLAIKKKRTELGIEFSKSYLSMKGKHAQSFLNPDKLCKINQNLKIEDLTDIVYQILAGSMLGDGCVHRSGNSRTRNFIFSELHRSKQLDYTDWKAEQLHVFHANKSRSLEKNYCQLWTASHPIFTHLRNKFYNNSNKYFLPLDILNNLDYLGLMIWYLDDGSLGTSHAEIAAKGWRLIDLVSLIKHINKKLGLSLYIKVYNHKDREGLDKKVYINNSNIYSLLPKWQKFAKELMLPTCMDYKLKGI